MITVEWPKWNKLINEAFIPYIENKDRYLIHIGGRGSGKSDYVAKKLIYRCLTEKYFRYILIRNVYDTIKDSSFQTLVDIIEDLGLASLFHITTSPLTITCTNGNKFIARGCDNTTKLKSVKDPTGAWYEEEIPEEKDFITITTSIRSIKADYLQEIFTVNPEVDGDYEEHWFYKYFFEGQEQKSFSSFTEIQVTDTHKEKINYTVHHSTYLDNRWIGDKFKAYLESLKINNPYYYQIYCLGSWGRKDPGNNPFISTFNRDKHIDNTLQYDPSKQLIISMDFNINPLSCIFAHMTRVNGVESLLIFNEVSIDNGSVDKLADYIYNNYGRSLPTVRITGDAMGKQRNISQRDNASLYEQLRGRLKLRASQIEVKSNPTHENSRADCNYFLDHFKNVKINEITCKNLIFDLLNVQCDRYGSIIKRNRLDFSQKSDFLDCFTGDTIIITKAGDLPIKDININDFVLTRNGYNKVVDKWDSIADVYEYEFIDGTVIKCTKDHYFFNNNIGFLPIFSIFDNNLSVCKLKRTKKVGNTLNTMGKSITSIQNKSISIVQKKKEFIRDAYIGKFGMTCMGLYRKATKYTTKTVMPLITTLTTSKVLIELNTLKTIWQREFRKTLSTFKNSKRKALKRLLSGIKVKRVWNGITSMQKTSHSESSITDYQSANIARMNIIEKQKKQDSAQIIVNQHGDENINQTHRPLNVKNAILSSLHTSTKAEDFAIQNADLLKTHSEIKVKSVKYLGKIKVYDITVENNHEFYANNILVHNCFRYIVNTFFNDWIRKDARQRHTKKI